MTAPTNGDRENRRSHTSVLNIILAFAAITMVAVILFAIVAIPSILTGTSNTEEVKKGTALSSCRARFSIQVSDAQAALIEAKAKLDVNTNRALRAATVERNPGVLAQLVAEAPSLEAAVQRAIDDSAARRAEFRAAGEQAITEPDGFVKQCKENR